LCPPIFSACGDISKLQNWTATWHFPDAGFR
jgi:hypothetical protein